MTKMVLDASAVLALLNQEDGSHIVEQHISQSLISAVNLAEVITVLGQLGMPYSEATELTDDILSHIVTFDKEQASITAELRQSTKAFGLSLGDRACLALAKVKALPVLTADSLWAQLDIGVSVQLIR